MDWSAFDLVVVRSTWDYAERRADFLAWASSLPHVLNPLPVLEWSTDKERYLTDLERAGVPVVPTRFLRPDDRFEPPGGPFVVKPAVSAGGRSTARFEPEECEAAEELVGRIHREGRVAMVQLDLGELEEVGLVYVGADYSHAVRRRVSLPSSTAQPGLSLAEQTGPHQASAAERAVAERALAAAGDGLLYARVDLAGGAVLELEAAEPSLYLGYGNGAAARFAAAISQRRRIRPDQGRMTSQ